jgi:hypothetical protein
MKKIIAAVALSLALVACSDDTETKPSPAAPAAQEAVDDIFGGSGE